MARKACVEHDCGVCIFLSLTHSLTHLHTHTHTYARTLLHSFFFTDFCYECLPPLVFQYSRTERVKLDNFIDALSKLDIVSEQTKRNRDVLKWAFCVVLTRAFGDAENELTIVPMGDMVRFFCRKGDCLVPIILRQITYSQRSVSLSSISFFFFFSSSFRPLVVFL